MSRSGNWSLSPAYDLWHSQGSDFTRNHQLSLNGKTNHFDANDLKQLALYAGLPRGRYKLILEQITEAFAGWSKLADELNIPTRLKEHVIKTLRLNLMSSWVFQQIPNNNGAYLLENKKK